MPCVPCTMQCGNCALLWYRQKKLSYMLSLGGVDDYRQIFAIALHIDLSYVD